MIKESMSLLDFQERFVDEQACLAHLFLIRWPRGFTCPRCGGRDYSFVSSRRLYQCSGCRYQTSLTAGTVFHKTRTPIRKWFWMIFMMTRQKSGVSILRMQKLLKIGSYRTAWLMGHKIREAMVDRDTSHKLAGLVEMDDAVIGRRKSRGGGNSGKSAGKILIGIERSGAKTGFRFVGHVNRKDLEAVAAPDKNEVAPESESNLKARSTGEMRKGGRLNRSQEIPEPPRHGLGKLRWVSAVIANIRGNIRGIHHGVSVKHFQRYLSEYCYRFNLRRWESQLFDRGLADCLATQALTWAELTS